MPVSGSVKSITVGQYDAGAQNYRTVGVLTLPIKQSWNFTDLFTSSFATAYAAGGHSINGSGYRDTLEGGAMADVIRPNSHNDWIYGNGGNDTLVLTPYPGEALSLGNRPMVPVWRRASTPCALKHWGVGSICAPPALPDLKRSRSPGPG